MFNYFREHTVGFYITNDYIVCTLDDLPVSGFCVIFRNSDLVILLLFGEFVDWNFMITVHNKFSEKSTPKCVPNWVYFMIFCVLRTKMVIIIVPVGL